MKTLVKMIVKITVKQLFKKPNKQPLPLNLPFCSRNFLALSEVDTKGPRLVPCKLDLESFIKPLRVANNVFFIPKFCKI